MNSFFKTFWSRIASFRPFRPLSRQDRDMHIVRSVLGRRIPSWQQLCNISHVMKPWERTVWYSALIVFVLSVVWFGIAFASQYRMQVPAVGGRYVEAIVGEPHLPNPIFSSTNDADMDIVKLVYSGLMRFDNHKRLLPDLAANYTVSHDKKTYIFHLRKDVVWQDGKPFTAHDVVFTFDTIEDLQTGSPLAITFQNVKVTASDNYTVIFTLPQPYAPFLSTLTVGILPQHVWSNTTPDSMRLADQNLRPIGTGPFKFSKLVKDDTGNILTYELTRFDRYYHKTAYIQTFIFQYYTDYKGVSNPIDALREGKIQGIGFIPHDLQSRVTRKNIDLHVVYLPQYTALFLNQNHNTVLKDPDVRQALSEAIDRTRILNESLDDEGSLINGPILPGSPGYNPNVSSTPYSVDGANKLLDKHYPRISYTKYRAELLKNMVNQWKVSNSDTTTTATSTTVTSSSTSTDITAGVPVAEIQNIHTQLNHQLNQAQSFFRKDKDGKILHLVLVTSDTSVQKHTAKLIAGFWQDIGVQTSLRFVDASSITSNVLKTRNYDVLLYGIIIGNDLDQYSFWDSSQAQYPGLNLSEYKNSKVDSLLVTIRKTIDENKLPALYQKLQKLILADRPAIFLYSPTYTFATSDNVHGVDVNYILYPWDRFADVTSWYVKTKGIWKK